ncbi:MAG TPA: potassium channel protein [Streptosporangiaceae bacterium]|nr:potassium channel protein [Streptosporangiaceae bacterium]
MSSVRRIGVALLAVLGVVVAGSIGYVVLGFSPLDAVYQTVTTITTVGFREVRPPGTAGKIFTIVLILVGVGTALYAFSVVLESLVEGHLRQHFERRRMERGIARMTGHTIVCGWGRVGRAVGGYLAGQGAQVVVVDLDPERVAAIPYPALVGDVTDDDMLRKAAIMQARALVAAINTDAENVYVTLSARALRPDLVIVARARTEASEPKLLRAGATRVVNPQRIGGQRIAAAALQPNVVEFLDVVMHEGSLEFRMEEVSVRDGSRLSGRTLREANVGETTGALVLAVRGRDGTFLANPPMQTPIHAGHVLIAIGTRQQLSALQHAANQADSRPGTTSGR